MSILAFEKFYVKWLEDMKCHIMRLQAALQQASLANEEEVAALVQACYSHYCEYIEEKIKLCKEETSFVVAGMWRRPLEGSFLWMGGWRPTTAVVLAYSLMGMQIESELQKLLEGIDLPTMASLSARQLSMLDALQQKLRTAEDRLSNRLAMVQMLLADQQIAKATTANPPPSKSNDLSNVLEAMEPKLAGFRDLLAEAEQLRAEAMKTMLSILRPIQVGQYALAAYEMTMAVRRIGIEREGNTQPTLGKIGAPTSIREIAAQGDTGLLQKVLESGVGPSEADNDGRTPLGNGLQNAGIELCRAAAHGDVPYVSRLVKYSIDPNVPDHGQRTALHAVAAAEGHAEVAKVLVREGANVLAKDRHGVTPLDEARVSNDQATIKLLEGEVIKHQVASESSMRRQGEEGG